MKKIFYLLAATLAVSGGLGANEDFEGKAERIIKSLNDEREPVVFKSPQVLGEGAKALTEDNGRLFDQKGMLNVQYVKEKIEEEKALIEKIEWFLGQEGVSVTHFAKLKAEKKGLEATIECWENCLFIQKTVDETNFRLGHLDGIGESYMCSGGDFYGRGYLEGIKERQIEQIKKNPKQAVKRFEKEMKEKVEIAEKEEARLEQSSKHPEKN